MTDDREVEKRMRAKLLGGTTAPGIVKRGRREVIVSQAAREAARKKQAAKPKGEARAPIVRFEYHEAVAYLDPPYNQHPETRWEISRVENGRRSSFATSFDGRDPEETIAELRAAGYVVEEIRAGTVMGPRR